ncbi:MAG: VWA domain-containing protein [Verrucomicrobiales bacterium]|nr:VWA domain-containing protein [Verrucomicrobiales bacterium]
MKASCLPGSAILRSTRLCAAILLAGVSLMADGLIIVSDLHPVPPVPRPGPMPPHTFAPLEVVYHHVTVDIRDQVARTAVDQEFHNPGSRQLEGYYIFPVPKGTQLDAFSMEVGGEMLPAELLDAGKARRLYEDIVRKHRDPALLEYADRDLFKVRIFPIEPHSTKRVKLSYTQVLTADAGMVEYRYPLNTEKFSAAPIQDVSVKVELRGRGPLKSVFSPTHEVEVIRHGGREATVGFEAANVRPDRDFQLLFSRDTGDLDLRLLTHATGDGEGFFLLLASPDVGLTEDQVAPKDVVFVLDTSGSMAGGKIVQAKKALQFCIDNLNDRDRFDIIRFSTDAEPLFDGLQPADPQHRQTAAGFIGKLRPLGGTAIHEALLSALRERPKDAGRPSLVIFLTDGLPTVGEVKNDAIVAAVESASGGLTRIFCFGLGHDVNTHLLDRITETTRAKSQYVLPEEDIELKVSSFFAKVSDPVLTDPRLTLDGPVRLSRMHPSPLPDLFKGDQLTVVGRFEGTGRGTLALSGGVAGTPRSFTREVGFRERARDNDFIPRLWAMRQIGFLLDEIRLRGENPELKEEVVQLARQYGIVTPYTSWLILEDEQRRGVPVAMQTQSALSRDHGAQAASRRAYESLTRDQTGLDAVMAARYGLASKSANQVEATLAATQADAFRAAPPATMSAPVAAGGRVPAGPVRGWMPLNAPGPASTAASPDQVQAVATQGPGQYVGGRTFYQNGERWIDSQVQVQSADVPRKQIQFGSDEYFALLTGHPETQPWLALGVEVEFVLDGAVYQISE